ncbi:MAG: type II CRISPR-associated endonuclease Cas1 [Terriglobia bacterium]
MGERVIDFSDRAAYLSVNNSLLVIRFPATPPAPRAEGGDDVGPNGVRPMGASAAGPYKAPSPDDPENEQEISNDLAPPRGEVHTVPLEEIAVVVVSHPQVTYSHAVLAGLAAAGGILIACDSKHLPAAMMLPLVTHSTQTERFAAQAKVSLPICKRAWQQIVKAKLEAQAQLLEYRKGADYGMRALAAEVRSGDPENVEARGARIYWRALFGDNFRRDREAEDLNRLLNYGYAVLRAITARAVCAAGLHPSLGIHHHNRYDAFCLADDVMEPYRPLVDRVVATLNDRLGPQLPLDRDTKRALLFNLLERYECADETRSLFDWVQQTASSLASVICEESEKLYLPRLRNFRDATHPAL